eukprot:Lankesteria_metandrocarpae@DN5243_c0_g1_i3.p1
MGKSAAFRSKSGGRVNGRTAFSSKSDSSSTQLNPATPCSTNDNNTSLSSLPSVSSQSIQEHTTSPSNSTRLTTDAASSATPRQSNGYQNELPVLTSPKAKRSVAAEVVERCEGFKTRTAKRLAALKDLHETLRTVCVADYLINAHEAVLSLLLESSSRGGVLERHVALECAQAVLVSVGVGGITASFYDIIVSTLRSIISTNQYCTIRGAAYETYGVAVVALGDDHMCLTEAAYFAENANAGLTGSSLRRIEATSGDKAIDQAATTPAASSTAAAGVPTAAAGVPTAAAATVPAVRLQAEAVAHVAAGSTVTADANAGVDCIASGRGDGTKLSMNAVEAEGLLAGWLAIMSGLNKTVLIDFDNKSIAALLDFAAVCMFDVVYRSTPDEISKLRLLAAKVLALYLESIRDITQCSLSKYVISTHKISIAKAAGGESTTGTDLKKGKLNDTTAVEPPSSESEPQFSDDKRSLIIRAVNAVRALAREDFATLQKKQQRTAVNASRDVLRMISQKEAITEMVYVGKDRRGRQLTGFARLCRVWMLRGILSSAYEQHMTVSSPVVTYFMLPDLFSCLGVAAVPSGSNHSASPANTPGGSNGFVQSRNPDRWIAPKTKEWNVDRQKERGKKANRNELWMENED